MDAGSSVQALTVRKPAGVPSIKGSILVVDDDEMIRNLFLELFRQEGVSIRVAGTAVEAVALMKQAVPSLLIVDVTLPDGNGISVFEEAQQIDNRILGVVMTGAPTVDPAI